MKHLLLSLAVGAVVLLATSCSRQVGLPGSWHIDPQRTAAWNDKQPGSALPADDLAASRDFTIDFDRDTVNFLVDGGPVPEFPGLHYRYSETSRDAQTVTVALFDTMGPAQDEVFHFDAADRDEIWIADPSPDQRLRDIRIYLKRAD